jgi:hypothetical protein
MRILSILAIVFFSSITLLGQTGPGIGVYPTGTEIGLGFRSSKDTRFAFDVRVARALFNSEKNKTSSFVSEVSVICRVVKLEKVRFNLGIGYRTDWNFVDRHRHGIALPVGVEAYPFPFQNAGLFFEVAPYFVSDLRTSNNIWGFRAASGFMFYFPAKTKKSLKS